MITSAIVLRISLDDEIWRDIEIAADASLYKLAELINQVFGFDFDHAFGFYDNLKNPYKSKTVYELFKDMGEPSVVHARSVKKSNVQDAFEKDKQALLFLFDYGDGWAFKVQRTSSRPIDAKKTYWKLLKSQGDAPEQYPSFEDEDDDGRTFDEKYEMKVVDGITVASRRDEK